MQYGNQSNRVNSQFEKQAGFYEKLGESNRITKQASLHFPSLSPYEEQTIIGIMKKEANELDGEQFEKSAAPQSTTFSVFGNTKDYIAKKMGISEDASHDLASSVVTKAQEFQGNHGGDIGDTITEIVDNMDSGMVQKMTGAQPMKKKSTQEVEEDVKMKLMKSLDMSAYQADSMKKIIVQQARNLLTSRRSYSLGEISDAIVRVLIDYQDNSIVYGISNNSRLLNEVDHYLNQ